VDAAVDVAADVGEGAEVVGAAGGNNPIEDEREGIPVENRKKIALIGAGNIGGEVANQICEKELGGVVLYDIPAREDFARGKALDLEHSSAIRGFDVSVRGTSRWSDCSGADVLMVTAGIARKPGQSRDDLIATNLPIIREVADHAKVHCPDAFVIVISNPLDAMVYEFKRRTGFPRERVVGMAGVLDSGRLQHFVARAAGVSVRDVRATVLGGHGDDMVPVLSASTVNGIPVSHLLSPDTIQGIVERTRKGGGEIVELMGTSAYFGPASSAIAMAESYLLDQRRILPCAAFLTGEYGYEDIYLGVPVVIGGRGVERIVELKLTAEEKAMLHKSANSVRAIVDMVRKT
jgi:malate dehydrogenase